MEKIVVKGGQRLTGRVKVEGAKNAVLPIQAASILASSGNIKLSNVPSRKSIQSFLSLGAISVQSMILIDLNFSMVNNFS